MGEYKTQFRPKYPSYGSAFSNDSLVDKITNLFYNSFSNVTWKDLTDDFIVTTKNDVNKITNDLKDGKIIYTSIAVGVGTGVLANFTSAYIVDTLGGSHSLIENVSLGAELLFHASGYAGTFILMSKAEGKSKKEITKDLTRNTLISLPISIGPYPLVRNPLAEVYMNNNILPELSTVLSQISLLPFYAFAVKYSITCFGPKVDSYLTNMAYFKNDKDTTKSLEKAITDIDLNNFNEKAS